MTLLKHQGNEGIVETLNVLHKKAEAKKYDYKNKKYDFSRKKNHF